MSLSKIRELREKRGKAVADAQALIPKTGETWTPENRQKFDGFMTEADNLKTQIDDMEREARAGEASQQLSETRRLPESGIRPNTEADRAAEVAAAAEYRSSLRRVAANAKRDVNVSAEALSQMKPESRTIAENMERRHWAAIREYLMRGYDMSAESRTMLQEFRDMGTGGGNALQGTGAGYFVPVGFVYDVEQALKYYGNMLNEATIMDTATGQPLPHPTDNDTTVQGELIGEGTQVTTQDINISSITLNAYKYSTKLIKVSLELLQDSAFDLESYIKSKFAIRLGRILNNHFTVGTGSSQPNGVITASHVGLSGSTTPAIFGDDNAASPDNTQQVGYTDLVNLEHSLDPLYRPGSKWMFHDQTLRYIKTLKDKYGRPLWVPGMAYNAPDEILGYEYSINNDMAQLAASAKTVAFGQLKKYMIRRVKELVVMRLNERFADYGQVAFIGFARYDGNLLDAGTHPIQLAQQHS